MLDGTVENYEKEANILALNRIYNDHLESYCNACRRKIEMFVKVQHVNYNRLSIEKEVWKRMSL